MTLENTKRIQGKSDNCTVNKNKDGKVYVGSITLEPDEAAEFVECLRTAFAELGVLPNTGQEKA